MVFGNDRNRLYGGQYCGKTIKTLFFLYYLYAVLRSANEVNELRYRIDRDGQVIFHDRVDIISPIAVPGKTFIRFVSLITKTSNVFMPKRML